MTWCNMFLHLEGYSKTITYVPDINNDSTKHSRLGITSLSCFPDFQDSDMHHGVAN